MSSLNFPYTVSYFKRYAIPSISPRSFTATISISGRALAILKKALPILPNPFIPTLIFFVIDEEIL